jgi:hypothetical protein
MMRGRSSTAVVQYWLRLPAGMPAPKRFKESTSRSVALAKS